MSCSENTRLVKKTGDSLVFSCLYKNPEGIAESVAAIDISAKLVSTTGNELVAVVEKLPTLGRFNIDFGVAADSGSYQGDLLLIKNGLRVHSDTLTLTITRGFA